MNYYSVSFSYYEFSLRVENKKYAWTMGDYRFPEDIDQIKAEYARAADHRLGLGSFILMRAEQIVRAAFMLNGYPHAHAYAFPDGSLYVDTKTEHTIEAATKNIEKYTKEFGIVVENISELNEGQLMQKPGKYDRQKDLTEFSTRKCYIDVCEHRGYFW